jgi:eukaryotic-like serine/threonine-protein kinase
MTLPAGTRLGRYELLGPLGVGGMGEVYRAKDARLGREVAVKVLPRAEGSPEKRKRFLLEAQAASALNHPGIVTVHDAGHEESVDYIVMEIVEGRTLREILEAGPLAVDDALGYVRQAAAALAVAHAAGIVHRDLKPQNLMVTTSGQLKILDFGLAHVGMGAVDSLSPTRERLTECGTVLGTPGYMSPEQVAGGTIDAQTDVFSLGVILYEMLTGRMPFRGSSVAALLYDIVHREPVPASRHRPGLAPEVTGVLDAMLNKDPKLRPANGGELLEALSGVFPAGATVQRKGVASAFRAWLGSRHPAAATALVVAAAAVALGALFTLGRWPLGRGSVVGRSASPAAGAAGAPSASSVASAYDRYLEGLRLSRRWYDDASLDGAIRLFREATSLDPSFALAFARLADAQRTRYAVTRDKSWLAEASKNAAEGARLNPGLAPVQVVLGRILATKGNNDLAFASFQRALAIDPNDAEANQVIARQYERLGRPKDAENAYRKASSLDPESFSILDSWANFLFRQGRFDEATRLWQDVIRLAPDNYSAFVNLGSALAETGRNPDAVTMYQRAVELKPSYMAYSNLGTSYSKAKRYEEAEKAYRKALELNDKDWMVWGNLGYVTSWQAGKEAEADRAFGRAIEIAESERKENARDTQLHSDLALYYAKTKRPRLATERLETALALSPQAGAVQAAGAEVFELLGQRERAIEMAKKSLELGFSRQQLQRNPEMMRLFADPRMQATP